MATGNTPDFRRLDAMSEAAVIQALERNGYLQAAEDIRAGKTFLDATGYVVGCEPPYNDAEGWRLQRYIDEIHGTGHSWR
jgi:hypothetical protein